MNSFIKFIEAACIGLCLFISKALADDYTLIILEDEDVPLASRAVNYGQLWLIAGCALLLLLMFVMYYFVKRNRLVKRVRSLREENGSDNRSYSIRITKLEDEILELENEIASSIGFEA